MNKFDHIIRTGNFIGGEWFEKGTDTVKVLDKYHQSVIAEVPLASESDIKNTLNSALEGFEEIKHWSAGKRSEGLSKIASLLENKKEAFAHLITAEAGKPIDYAYVEVERALNTLRIAAAEALTHTGETVPINYGIGEGKTAYTKRFPIGPVLCISPFNFPLNLAMHKLAPALASGCPVIVKPPPQAPLSCLALAALCQEAGFPKGSINVLLCNVAMAEKLVRDERPEMLSFTGSSKVGWHLKNICGRKKVTLELGGNAAAIVDETADLNRAVDLLTNGAYSYAGQVCISTQRIYVKEEIYEQFLELLISKVEKIKSGNPYHSEVINGPIIDSHHLNRINDWVKEAKELGASILTGGKILDGKHHIYAPTLITNTSHSMQVVCDEVFGPVAIIEKIKDFDEGIACTNNSPFGLQAAVFTNRLDRMKQAHQALEVGGIIINNVPGFRIDNMPYGGIKHSGLGREGIKYAMDEMTEPRLIIY
ncbi:aldehyde dehydrogenase family protein [Fulvivirgaceae bacterium BMA10]|uniref:Aldehyde dehydrogenase family protein n=1 Tax=Splendidivirga corallicola TaxID=3051826 RepID=A0ABT8KT00_9BACT|nr:aldehyde dehydrogenase family protein [Fulvivirgaceae bacterium BMA10]